MASRFLTFTVSGETRRNGEEWQTAMFGRLECADFEMPVAT